MRPTVDDITRSLDLDPHPEGGFFRETYRAVEVVETPRGKRPASTAILFLVTIGSVSRLHRLASDELWVFQGGLPLELTTLSPHGVPTRHLLGDPGEASVDEGEGVPVVPQALAPAGWWQGARLAGSEAVPPERAWSLVSCIVTPGFEFEDFEMGDREALVASFPSQRELILALT